MHHTQFCGNILLKRSLNLFHIRDVISDVMLITAQFQYINRFDQTQWCTFQVFTLFQKIIITKL